MIQVGGHAATLLDFEIPARHGLRQTIADTLGIGGIFRALRTIPVMLEIGRDMAELCPDAWLLNYTNPMAMLCQAYGHGSPHTKIVGLCHSVQHTTRQLAEYVGVPFEEVTFLGAGVNHQSFILRFEHEGRTSTRAWTLRSRLTRSCSARCAWSSTGASATSRPSRASTRPSTCRG